MNGKEGREREADSVQTHTSVSKKNEREEKGGRQIWRGGAELKVVAARSGRGSEVGKRKRSDVEAAFLTPPVDCCILLLWPPDCSAGRRLYRDPVKRFLSMKRGERRFAARVYSYEDAKVKRGRARDRTPIQPLQLTSAKGDGCP